MKGPRPVFERNQSSHSDVSYPAPAYTRMYEGSGKSVITTSTLDFFNDLVKDVRGIGAYRQSSHPNDGYESEKYVTAPPISDRYGPDIETCGESGRGFIPGTFAGSTEQFVGGKQKLIPVPSTDPLDPLNIPAWRKHLILGTLTLFSVTALLVQFAIGGMIPLFEIYYDGLDPKLLNELKNGIPRPPPNKYGHVSPDLSNSFQAYGQAYGQKVSGPSAQAVSMLSSLPSLIMGISNFVFVPLANAVGRRPVIIILSAISFASLPWAASSGSLSSHLAARCVQGLGTGASVSLVPLIIQDMTFIHERNKYMGILWGLGGASTCGLGIAAFQIVARLGWRWFYWIVSIPSGVAVILMFVFVLETKFDRTQGALEGDISHLPPGEVRPQIDWNMYRRKPWGWRILARKVQMKEAWYTMLDMCKVFLFPNVTWLVLINSCFMGNNLTSSMTNAVILLEQPYAFSFSSLGYTNTPLLISSVFYYFISGVGADKVAMWLTQRNGGHREPEFQLANFILPISAEITSTVLFGFVGENPENFHWIWMFVSMTIGGYGFLALNSVASVYAIECYPMWAGSILVVVTALRNIFSFGMSFGVYSFIERWGYENIFGIFAGVTAGVGIFILPVYVFGKQIRHWSIKTFQSKSEGGAQR